MNQPSAKHDRPHPWMRPVAEFICVFGASLILLFIVIPSGTVEMDNFGLSPRMLPIVTATTIAVMAVITLVLDLLRGPSEPKKAMGMRGVLQLGAAAIAGVILVDRTGIVIGGTLLVLLCTLAIGERRILSIAGMGAGALFILLLVEWSGL